MFPGSFCFVFTKALYFFFLAKFALLNDWTYFKFLIPLQYAHRACVQRWCDEKGDVICEICHEVCMEIAILSFFLLEFLWVSSSINLNRIVRMFGSGSILFCLYVYILVHLILGI
jgi:RING-variant domain